MKRGSGVLLHISSLPGPYGIGCFGAEALRFARLLAEAGMSYWQVLPFSVPGKGNSPYTSLSAFAGNPMFISPDDLVRKGWVTEKERTETITDGDPLHADFKWCKEKRSGLLRKAYQRISDDIRKEVEEFIEQKEWPDDLALFLLIRRLNGGSPWWEWTDEDLRRHDPGLLAVIREKHREEYLYYCFVQYVFYAQWSELKRDINRLGISVIGDIPIYVSRDSADVWAHRELFQIDSRLRFLRVSGVPPDYFSEEGQLWGNPLYDWAAHADEDYRWWRSRLVNKFGLYDLLRIDHFRGFSSYWSVESDREDARDGTWEKGPGAAFFNRLRLDYPDPPIFSEDLGEITGELQAFLDDAGFPGMRVFQFAFCDRDDNKHRPHNYPKSCVAYSGTHDNDTSASWYGDLSEENTSAVREYTGLDLCEGIEDRPEAVCKGIVRTLMQSHADLIIFPLQDLLYMGSSRRMNIPGTESGNWAVRFSGEEIGKMDTQWLQRMNRLTGRA